MCHIFVKNPKLCPISFYELPVDKLEKKYIHFFKEALMKWARAFGERVWRKTRFEKGRIASKAPPKAADH